MRSWRGTMRWCLQKRRFRQRCVGCEREMVEQRLQKGVQYFSWHKKQTYSSAVDNMRFGRVRWDECCLQNVSILSRMSSLHHRPSNIPKLTAFASADYQQVHDESQELSNCRICRVVEFVETIATFLLARACVTV